MCAGMDHVRIETTIVSPSLSSHAMRGRAASRAMVTRDVELLRWREENEFCEKVMPVSACSLWSQWREKGVGTKD